MENGIIPFHLKKKVEQVIYAQLLSCAVKKAQYSTTYGSMANCCLPPLLVRRLHRYFGDSLEPERERDITPWRLWTALKDEAITLITGALYWKLAQRKAAVDVLKERPRKRKLQTLLQPVAKLVANFS